MTKEEIKKLWLESGKTLVVEICVSEDGILQWIEADNSQFKGAEGYYRFKDGQDFSVINNKVKKAWEDSGRALHIEVTDPHGGWIDDDILGFFPNMIYRVNPRQEDGYIYGTNDELKAIYDVGGYDVEIFYHDRDKWVEAKIPAWADGYKYRLKLKEHSKSTKAISEVCKEIEQMLLDKNRKYGDSALNPIRVFSNASADEQIRVRIDDKICRIKSAQGDDLEDAKLDLIGYLILERVYKNLN